MIAFAPRRRAPATDGATDGAAARPSAASPLAAGPLSAGPVAILCATCLMALQDTMVKVMSVDLPLWQLFLIRSLIVIAILAVIFRRGMLSRLRAATHPWAIARSALIVSMYIWFYAALPLLDLSLVAAVYYTSPLLIVLLSGLLLHERVSRVQAVAMGVAIAGVLLVLRPATDDFSVAALIPLASALSYALAALVTRRFTARIDPWTLTLSLNLVFSVVGGAGVVGLMAADPEPSYAFLMASWAPLDAGGLFRLVALAVISLAIHVFLARAYQRGPMAVVASLDFSYLGFVAFWALMILGTMPDWPTVAGTVLIGAAGLMSMARPAPRHGADTPPRPTS